MRISYDIGDSVNIVYGAHTGVSGVISDIKEGGTGKKVLVKTISNKIFECHIEQIMPSGVQAIYSRLLSKDYFYKVSDSDNIWKLNVTGDCLVNVNNILEKREISAQQIVARISKENYERFSKRGIPMDNREFWLYNDDTGEFAGPVHFDGSVIRTRNNSYIEMQDIYKGISCDQLAFKLSARMQKESQTAPVTAVKTSLDQHMNKSARSNSLGEINLEADSGSIKSL